MGTAEQDVHQLHFSLPSDFTVPNSLSLVGNPMRILNSAKLLGVIIPTDMNNRQHHEAVLWKCASAMHVLRKLYQHGFSSEQLWDCYLALVFSHMSYAFPAVCDVNAAFTKKFKSIENQAIRIPVSIKMRM